MDRMKCFCEHARAMLTCYVDLTPEQQTLARLYAARKLASLDLIQTAAHSPGGKLAGQLLRKMQQVNEGGI